MKLQHRTGPYVIRIAPSPQKHAASTIVIVGTVTNVGSKALVPSTAFGSLNMVAPYEKARFRVTSLAPNHSLEPGAVMHFRWQGDMSSTGTRHLNVSYGNVDSNTLTIPF